MASERRRNGAFKKKKHYPNVSAADRLKYVEDTWRDDLEENGKLTISTRSMHDRLHEIFGQGARDAQLVEIKNRVLADFRADAGKPLTARPLAALSVVNDPEPEPEPEEQEMPDKPPGSTNSDTDIKIRKAWAFEFIRTHPTATHAEIIEACRSEFGVGISAVTIGDFRRELGIGLTQKRIDEGRLRRMPGKTTDAAAAVKTAVQLLLDECPDLEWLEVKIEDGRPVVNYRVAVKKVETGSVTL